MHAYEQWDTLRGERARREFCQINFLSARTLSNIAATKRELLELLSEIGFVRGAAKLRAGAVERLGAGASGSDGVRAALGAGGGSEQLHGELQMRKA